MNKKPTKVKDGGYVVEERPPQTVDYARFYTNNYGHEVWDSLPPRQSQHVSVMVHRLVAVAQEGFDSLKGKVVHHKNHIPFDNRPENLELMSREDHTSHHVAERKVPRDELLADLKAGYEALGVAPTSKDIAEFGEYSVTSYKREFGSFPNALRAAGIPPRKSQLCKEKGESNE